MMRDQPRRGSWVEVSGIAPHVFAVESQKDSRYQDGVDDEYTHAAASRPCRLVNNFSDVQTTPHMLPSGLH